MAPSIFTIGHSNHDLGDFLALLARHEVEVLVDVRRHPSSRRVPHFNAPVLAGAVAGYRHMADLGGFREPAPGTPNTGWREEAFRGYADHMASEAFARALATLEGEAELAVTAVMCAEADWRHCHRQLLADALVIRGWRVRHIGPGGDTADHVLTPFALADGTALSYPPAQASLDL